MYQTIIKKSFRHAWRNKNIWLLGIFASFLGTLEESELIRNFSLHAGQEFFTDFTVRLYQTELFSLKGLKGIFATATHDPLFFIQTVFFILLALSVFLACVWLAIISQGGLIAQATNDKSGNSSFSSLVRPGIPQTWGLVILNIISKVITVAIFAFMARAWFFPLVTAIPLIIISLVILALMFIVLKYAFCAKILTRAPITRTLTEGYTIARAQLKESLRLLIWLMVINILIVILAVTVTFFIFIPFFLIITAAFLMKFLLGVIVMFGLFAAITLFLFVAVFGFLSTVSWTAWTHLYLAAKK